MYDLLLHRYHDMGFVLSMEPNDFLALLAKAREERDKRAAWELWLTQYPHMTKETFEPFEVFWEKSRQTISTRPSSEILAEAAEIQRRIESQRAARRG